MGKPTTVATQTDIDIARIGMTIQAEAHGLDMTDPKIIAFLEHMIQTSAQASAMCRFLQNIIHKPLTDIP